MKIGWIGLGHMGTPMSLNLVKAGYDVAVYNRSTEKTATLAEAGATVYPTVRELCENSDIIFTMLADDYAASEVFNSIVENNIEEKLIVNMSTISASGSKKLQQLCEANKAAYLEAPVSGSVKPATDGTLLILAGGAHQDYNRVLPMFEKMGKMTLLLGDVGFGSKAKIAINYFMATVIDGLAETVVFAEKEGISRETMMQIVNASACGSSMTNMKTTSIIKNEYPAAFPLKHMLKDIRLAQNENWDTLLSTALEHDFNLAAESGLADADLMSVIDVTKSNK